MSQKKLFFTVLCFIFLFGSLDANASTGKVRSVLGDVSLQKKSQGAWRPLRVSMSVSEADFIRTLLESQTIISIPDGSSITVEENSLVTLEKLFAPKGSKETALDIKQGRLQFDIQKQNSASGSFQFKTGTATAAIRGTSGGIGLYRKGLFAGLQEGLLEVEDFQGNKVLLRKGQTLIQDSLQGFIIIDNPLSGNSDFSKALQEFLNDTTRADEITPALLDSLSDAILVKINALLKKANCRFTDIQDTVFSPQIQISGSCEPGILILVDGHYLSPTQNKNIEQIISWAPSLVGEKNYRVYCIDDEVSALCGDFKFNYANPLLSNKQAPSNTFTITSPKSLELCEKNTFKIEGFFESTHPDIELKIHFAGNTTENLIAHAEENKFSKTFSVSDLNNTWNETKAIVEMSSPHGIIKKEEISLKIDKKCKAINQIPSQIQWISNDSLKCRASFRISNAKDDETLVSTHIDNSLSTETLYQGNQNRIFYKLKPGVHLYRFKASDLAQNEDEITKTLGCFPKRRVSVQIFGAAHEIWRRPPPPIARHSKDSLSHASLKKELRFYIKNIPQNDPAYINEVLVKKNGILIFKLLEEQVKDVHYTLPIDIDRGSKNTFEVEVKLKSGNTSKAIKIYEVK